MSQTEFLAGETARFSVAITDITGAAADPGVLRLRLCNPAGSTTTYTYGTDAEVVRSALGSFHADLPLASAGVWIARWESDAPNPGAGEERVVVQRSSIPAA